MPLATLKPQSSRFINLQLAAVAPPASDWPAKFSFDEFWNFTESLEGGLAANCMFMDQDLQVATAMGMTFTGKANRDVGLAMATDLEWIFKLGHPNALRTCGAADIARDYDAVLGMEELGRQGPGHLREWRAATNCRLTVDGLKRAVRNKVLDNINDLRTRRTGDNYLGDFDSFPADAQLCVASLAWANGNEFGSPEFCKACQDADWFEAAKECGPSSKENTLPRRQKAQEEMMRNAGCVKLRVASPDVLHWPTILSAPSGPTGPTGRMEFREFSRYRWADCTDAMSARCGADRPLCTRAYARHLAGDHDNPEPQGDGRMSKWKLAQPPTVKQGIGYKCWAAALESWCAVTPSRHSWTQNQLLERRNVYVKPFDPTLPEEGSINAQVFKIMNEDLILRLNMEFEEKTADDKIGQDYFFNLLFANGYLLIVYTANPTSGVRHANVLWSADSDGYSGTMDPMRGAYINKTIEEFRAPFLVAWASKQWADPFKSLAPWAYVR